MKYFKVVNGLVSRESVLYYYCFWGDIYQNAMCVEPNKSIELEESDDTVSWYKHHQESTMHKMIEITRKQYMDQLLKTRDFLINKIL